MEHLLDQCNIPQKNQLPDAHHISHRRKIGAYYTPIEVTRLLCGWGVRTITDRIFEPCFGGCTFLEAAVQQLRALGHASPQKNVFGCDIDPLAFRYLEMRLGASTISSHFFQTDFLKLAPNSVSGETIDFVVGNPPYIRHDKLSADQKISLEAWKKNSGFKLNGRSSLWAYFILHSLNFLKKKGRLALVLPGSFLTAQYAQKVRKIIEDRFARVSAITLTERLFVSEGTEELTIILLAEGYGEPPASQSMQLYCLENVSELKDALNNWGHSNMQLSGDDASSVGTGMVPNSAICAMNMLRVDRSVKRLGEIASIHIGVVTGNKKFFIKSASEWGRHKIEKRHLQYIAPRSLFIQGLSITEDDISSFVLDDVPCLALKIPARPRAKSLITYLDTYPKQEIEANSTFAKREVWHQFLDDKVPDAMLVFMTDFGPRLLLNEADVNCTNSLYRVYFSGMLEINIKLVAISFVSTFTQISAELIGHGRGSGALKLEPSDAAKVEIYLPTRTEISVNEAFKKINQLMRAKQFDEAAQYADNYLFQDSPIFLESLQILRTGLDKGRLRRMRTIKRATHE